jgi:recombination protein RecT
MTEQQSKAVLPSEQNQDPPTVTSMIARLTPELQRAAPKGMNGDRVARLALTAVRLNPDLGNTDPLSFAGALLTATALGLEPGVNGEAYLVPYSRECQLIIGYQGLVKLFWQHPLAQYIDCQAVYEADEFDYAYGLTPFLTHKPGDGNRGEVTHYYAVARLTNGGTAMTVLTRDQVKALRGREGTKGNIADPQRWMERKTVLRQLLKTLPKSTQLASAMQVDEATGTTLRSGKVAEAIHADQPVGELTSGGDQ